MTISGFRGVTGLLAATAISLFLTLQPLSAQQTPPADAAAPAPADMETVQALEKRVKSLEQQMIDLRTMIGAVQSQGGGAPAVPMGAPAPQYQDTGAAPRAAIEPVPGEAPAEGMSGMSGMGGLFGMFGSNSSGEQAGEPAPADNARQGETAAAPTFAGDRGGFSAPREPEAAPAQSDLVLSDKPEEIYRQAYGFMLARDYVSAETAFKTLIEQHPRAEIAGNSQYWLGETYYVRGQYRPAADAFLKAYRDYPNGVKAPDSLLKLAITLGKLGETDAACRTFGQLGRSYPNAPEHIRQKSIQEQQRAGCS